MHSYCRRVPFTTLQKCFPEINKKFIEIHKTFFQLAEKFSCIRNKVPWVKTGTNYILHFLFCMKKDLMNFGKYLRVPSIVWPKDSNLVTYKISRVYAPKKKHSHQFTTFFEMSNVVCGTVIPIFGQPYDTSQSNPQVSPGKFGKKNKRSLYILISVWLWNFKDGGS